MKYDYAPSTKASTEKTVNYFKEWCKQREQNPETLTYNQLLEYLRHLKEQGNKQVTIQLKVGRLRTYYASLINEQKREDNPAELLETLGVKRKQLHAILELETLKALYENYPEKEPGTVREKVSLASRRDKVIVGLLVYQGITTREAIDLKTEDLQLRKGQIEIRGSRRSNRRTLPLESFQIVEMMEYLEEVREQLLSYKNSETDYLFITAEDGKQSTFKTRIASIMNTLRREDRSFTGARQLRTSVITHWLKTNNLREVQYKAGHKYVSSTESYQVNDLDQLVSSIEKYHPIS